MSADAVDRGISKLEALGQMAKAINDVVTPHGKISEIPDDTLLGYHEMTTAYANDFRGEVERRGLK